VIFLVRFREGFWYFWSGIRDERVVVRWRKVFVIAFQCWIGRGWLHWLEFVLTFFHCVSIESCVFNFLK
jgi:hypothetical protein